MAKFPTYPTLYDDCLTLTISFLKKYGYLKPGQFQTGTSTWSVNGHERASISLAVNTQAEKPYIELSYSASGEARKYQIQLVTIPSNIGKGEIWYFLCTATKKLCRKLYLIGGYFYHREAFKGCMYSIQTESKEARQTTRKYKPMYKGNEYDQLKERTFRRFYNGVPTKRYLRILKKIDAAEKMPDPFFDRVQAMNNKAKLKRNNSK